MLNEQGLHINLTWNCRGCVGVAFLFVVRLLAKPYHFRVNWPTTLCENKDGVHFFALNFEYLNRYDKLLLCNSENGDIAWCKENNSDGVFVFLSKPVSFVKKQKNIFWIKTGFSQPWVITIRLISESCMPCWWLVSPTKVSLSRSQNLNLLWSITACLAKILSRHPCGRKNGRRWCTLQDE